VRTFDLLRFFLGVLPTIVAVLRRRRTDRAGMLVIGFIMAANLIIGTFSTGVMVIVWFALMAAALSTRPDAFLRRILFGGAGQQGSPAMTSSAFDPVAQNQRSVCSQCGGTGYRTCPSCNGRGSWYESPQTASGVAQLTGCNYCARSGKVQCIH
jgi:hypothetical protein